MSFNVLDEPRGVERILEEPDHSIHLIGVAGSGVSGLARLLLEKGFEVSGSDLKRTGQIDSLVKKGLKFKEGHDALWVGEADLVVYSSAVRENNVERLEALGRKIPQMTRGEALAMICRNRTNVVVAGTHGKTTSAAMLASVLRSGGRDAGFYIGAEVAQFGANAHWGGADEMVLESDESDGSILHLNPAYTLLLNVEEEHLDFFKDLAQIREVFDRVLTRTERKAVCCVDCPEVARLAKGWDKVITYALEGEADYAARQILLTPRGASFEVLHGGKCLGTLNLLVPGRHNVSNALGVTALALELGVPFEKIAEGLAMFRGASRRFEILFEDEDYLVVDDYAHHPSEVAATLAAARSKGRKRILAVFQPHRYSRTGQLKDDFAGAFGEADRVFVTDIYAASEHPVAGLTGEVVAKAVEERSGCEVGYYSTLARLRTALRTELRKGDCLLAMGAGDVGTVAQEIAWDLRVCRGVERAGGSGDGVRLFEPMRRHTTLRVGGPATCWVEVEDESHLGAVLAYCTEEKIPVTVIGRGSNLLVRDGGIRGVCIHLSGVAFRRIEVEGDRLVAGAGARLKDIVFRAKKAGLGGLEFLEGIPGNLGGALRMNAGAMGKEIFDVVESVRYVTRSGDVREKGRGEIAVNYRNVSLFGENIALSAVLNAQRETEEEITERIAAYSKKRWASQPAVASAGCTFKNIPNSPSGKLIDELGLKNFKLGGARVSDVHANFIVNDGDASAEDVLQLIAYVRKKVREERGIDLEVEVKVIGEEG